MYGCESWTLKKAEWMNEVAQSCPTLCDPVDCSLSGSSVHGIFQATVLEWIAISFSSGSSQPRDRTWVSCIVDRCFTVWATREVKKAECRRIDAFELWCWRRLLRVLWRARRFNQSILNEIISEYSLEGLILKLKLQSFGYLMRRADSLEKTLMLGKNGGGRRRDDRGWDGWMASLTQRTWAWVSSGSWWRTGKPGELQSMGLQRVRHDWATELNWEDNHL